MRKINLYFLTLLFLIFSNPSLAIDDELRDIVDSIDAAKKDFNDVDTSEVMEAVKIDKAFEQIDKVTEFVKESLEKGNEESAIKALELLSRVRGAKSDNEIDISEEGIEANIVECLNILGAEKVLSILDKCDFNLQLELDTEQHPQHQEKISEELQE